MTRQEIYDRIRSSSRDQFIMEEMLKLGFISSESLPPDTSQILIKEIEIRKELSTLYSEKRKYNSQEEMIKAMRKERFAKAKEKRKQTKDKNEKIRIEKKEKWVELQKTQVLYLGKKHSKGLNNTISNHEKLAKYNLPEINSVLELTNLLEIGIEDLRFLCYERKVSKTNHYYDFEVPKKSGGTRKLSAPKKRLKSVQSHILQNILNKISFPEMAHGFIKNKSITTNALPHVGKEVVLNIDLENFFPTISYQRVKGLFISLGYSEQISIILSLLCTKCEAKKVRLDGQDYFVYADERKLPQGSPVSPIISNMILLGLDKRIDGLAKKYGFSYTRYADDLTFSCQKENAGNLSKLIYYTKKIITDEGFNINDNKTHVMRSHRQQTVTGIVVNEKLSLDRNKLRNFRAVLHNIKKNGWGNQKWGKAIHLINGIEGTINFINMVSPEKGRQFVSSFDEIVKIHGRPNVNRKADLNEAKLFPSKELTENKVVEKLVDENNDSITDWWNIF